MKPPEQPPGAPGAPDRKSDPSLDDLQARIDKARGSAGIEGAARPHAAPPKGMAAAFRLSTELFAGVVVGGGLGYVIDRTFGISPFGLIVFILVGFAAGTTNLIRAASRSGNSSGNHGKG